MADSPAGAHSTAPVLVAIDQGTSSTKVLVIDASGAIVSSAVVPIGQAHPQPGWVEQDAEEIAQSVFTGIRDAATGFGERIAGLGLSSQRESALVWDRATGQALGPVLGWQDRRTTASAAALTQAGHAPLVREITGLPIDPMFSALKLGWLLDQVDPDRVRSAAGEICVGTIDSWLLFRLTGEHRIESGNASRTQLLNLHTVDWDERLLELFRVPRATLPLVTASSTPSAVVHGVAGLPAGTRVRAVMGDSHSALYAHGVRQAGAVKVTYGTGSSIMGLLPAGETGSAGAAADGLVTTLAWQTDTAHHAFEGNILSTGSTMVWLAELLGRSPGALFELAQAAPADHGLDLVPAFSGLGAPWWDENARALVIGLTLGTTPAALARAAAESIALQIEDVLAAADARGGPRIDRILVDGGPSANDWLMQLQADLSQREVIRPEVGALSALGVAYLAGIGAGVWTDAQVLALPRRSTSFSPSLDPAAWRARRHGWLAAVAAARGAPPGTGS
ncbi:FGGY family carbohydrate kinase [Cryobacterium sp. SO2]|uniref:FGGY family carbohydrate kinase n=1 Tax=Cryobacterium sp. SO2 TaxID=1897060 RepID=UPI00223DBB2C|nr:FGGY family carbohydrate kinase [Cryobacterium sp. SO2]WEO76865.1 FGGY family carbohydrate kinase [Cryobacterium sp. SO2]